MTLRVSCAQVGDALLSVDGVDVSGGRRSLGEAAKKGQTSHELIVQRKESKSTRGGTRGFKKGDVATKFTLSLSTAVGGDGVRRLGLALDDANRVVRLQTTVVQSYPTLDASTYCAHQSSDSFGARYTHDRPIFNRTPTSRVPATRYPLCATCR